MKFSIITPSYGQGKYIRKNIESVLHQNWADFEHIVVDGGSQDDTVAILKEYSHLTWISETDEGQADALNKGFKMITGDIVGWINSDDYYNENVFAEVAACFEDPSVQWVVGDLAVLNDANGELYPHRSPPISFKSLQENPDIVRQQSTFFRKSFLAQSGGWNKKCFMVMDFDLWVRLAKVSSPLMLSRQLAVFRIQKDQKSGLDNMMRQTNEMVAVLRREGASSKNILALRAKKRWQWCKGKVKKLLIDNGLLDKKYILQPMRGWSDSKK